MPATPASLGSRGGGYLPLHPSPPPRPIAIVHHCRALLRGLPSVRLERSSALLRRRAAAHPRGVLGSRGSLTGPKRGPRPGLPLAVERQLGRYPAHGWGRWPALRRIRRSSASQGGAKDGPVLAMDSWRMGPKPRRTFAPRDGVGRSVGLRACQLPGSALVRADGEGAVGQGRSSVGDGQATDGQGG
jgi:hypothetical protein